MSSCLPRRSADPQHLSDEPIVPPLPSAHGRQALVRLTLQMLLWHRRVTARRAQPLLLVMQQAPSDLRQCYGNAGRQYGSRGTARDCVFIKRRP